MNGDQDQARLSRILDVAQDLKVNFHLTVYMYCKVLGSWIEWSSSSITGQVITTL